MNPADLQLDWLRAFVAVVDAGSLAAAAPLLHRSPSAMSMQLKKLEEVVGAPVLVRDPRHTELTPTGQKLLGYARRILELHDETLTVLHGPDVSGKVTLGVPDDYAFAYLTSIVRAFANRYPGVEICLFCEPSTVLVPKVQQGVVDLAIITRDRPDRGTLLAREPLLWAGAGQYELWRKSPLPIAVYETGSRLRREVLAALGAQRRPHRIVYSSQSLVGMVAAVESGLALAVLSACVVPPHLQILGAEQGLPALPALEIAVVRSKASAGVPAVTAMREEVVRAVRHHGASRRVNPIRMNS